MKEFLQEFSITNFNIWKFTVYFGILIIAFIVGKTLNFTFKRIANKRIEPEMQISATFFMALAKSSTFILFSIGFAIDSSLLKSNLFIYDILSTGSRILITISIGHLLYSLIEVPALWFELKLDSSEKNINKMIIPVIRRSMQITLFILVVIQIIQILSNKPITSIIAGLGIGGLAIALAAQDTIKHFFGSMILIGDKPFQIGDRVVIDGYDGPVEEVGLRSTRIRTLEGFVVTIPNGELANKTIQNISKRESIRRIENIKVAFDTPKDKILRAIEIINEIMKDHDGMNPDFPPKAYFDKFNSDSLNIFIIYWYFPADFWGYMDFSQWINLEIISRFKEEGIQLAHPSQEVYLAGERNNPTVQNMNNPQ